ncbi:MAG TPA: BPSS1780 family membrane protein [Azospira sp.]|nr:BPSS1780 family membrane protein [Azospira sp.]
MQALQLSARQGWGWLTAGFALFRKNPAQLTMIIIGYWLLIVFVNSLPLIGPVLATLTIPAFSVGLMNTCRELDRGRPVLIPVLFAGFRIPQTKTLLVLGALYLAVSLFALAVSALADGGLFMQTMLGSYQPTEEDMARGELVAGAQLALLVMAPAIMAWWFAPVLVAWHGVSAGKALFFSFVACVRNWKPFLAYTACVTLFGALLPGLLVGVLAAVLPALAPFLTSLILVPLLLILAPALVASFYVSYREVFVSSERPLRAVIDESPGDD